LLNINILLHIDCLSVLSKSKHFYKRHEVLYSFAMQLSREVSKKKRYFSTFFKKAINKYYIAKVLLLY